MRIRAIISVVSPMLLAAAVVGVVVLLTGSRSTAVLAVNEQAGNPSANLDQWANTDNQWVNGNLGQSKAMYFEGDSIPYRMRFDNLTLTGSHTVTIEWDTTKSGKHAIDYLTTYDRSASPDPCAGVTGCGSASSFPIPADPQVTGAGVSQIAGNLTLYGGTITAVSPYSYPNGSGFAGDKSARITITFTASVANPVLAWGGHIATRLDWGSDNSAVAIPGSPYHMRLIDLDGKGGNQDRSLSEDAVIFPGSIRIVKDATPNGSTSFPFTASSPLSPTSFSLVDDGSSANTRLFSSITAFQVYTIAETTPPPAGWQFDRVQCAVSCPNGGSQNGSGSTVTIDLKEGENVTCTFANSQVAATSTPTAAPTNTPTNTPTSTPTSTPTNRPTSTPAMTPTTGPTSTPTPGPTSAPTNTPTPGPTSAPTNTPTATPTSTVAPTNTPSTPPGGGTEADLFCVQDSAGIWSLRSATRGTPEYSAILAGPHQTPVGGQCPANPTPLSPTATPVPPAPVVLAAAPLPPPAPTVAAPPPPPAPPAPTPAPEVLPAPAPGVPAVLPYTGEAQQDGSLGWLAAATLLLVAAGITRRSLNRVKA